MFEVADAYDCEFQQVFYGVRGGFDAWSFTLSSLILTSFRPHTQQTLLEITGRRCCASRTSPK